VTLRHTHEVQDSCAHQGWLRQVPERERETEREREVDERGRGLEKVFVYI
jgi:hypothetical protein